MACIFALTRRTLSTTIKNVGNELNPALKRAPPQSALRHKNSTVDDAEVEKHSKMSQDWWAPNGSMKALHAYNHIRIPFIRDGILGKNKGKSAAPLIGNKILDVGCGGGILSEPLARLGAQVTGVDASQELIELAQSHSKLDPKLAKNPPTYIFTTVEEHVTKHRNHYDAVVASEVIEHVADKELFVKSCVEGLAPGGSIFFTTPSRTWLGWLGGIVIAENVLGIVPKGTHEWDKFTTPTELSHLLERKTEDFLRYVAVKPNGSMSHLRQKLWHLLDLPDFCDEVMVLRTNNGISIPLNELRRGNKPEYPFILEVWSPPPELSSLRFNGEDKMLTFSNDSKNTICEITTVQTSIDKSLNIHDDVEEKFQYECRSGCKEGQSYVRKNNQAISRSFTPRMDNQGFEGKKYSQNQFSREFNMKSDLSCKMSSSSIRFKLSGRKKSKDNFINILEKIQNDLSSLSSKIGVLENKIPR